MNRYSKQYPEEIYKPGGITKKIDFYYWMIRDRSRNIEDSDPLSKGDRVENLGDWKHGLMEFTSKPNNDPDVIKTILQTLIDLSKNENPTDLYMYMDELKKIKITNEDINYLLDIFNTQRETFESVYFDDVSENIDEADSRARAETEMFNEYMPKNDFDEQTNRRISKNYKSMVKLAAYYDQTKQYKKADKITIILNKYNNSN
jgi:hypothetical protein